MTAATREGLCAKTAATKRGRELTRRLAEGWREDQEEAVRLRAAMRPWAQNDEGRVQMKEMGREAMGLTTNSTTAQEKKPQMPNTYNMNLEHINKE